MRRALVALALTACSLDLAPTQPWTPADSVTGDMAPELSRVVVSAPETADPAAGVRSLRVVSFNVERGGDVAGLAAALSGHPELSRARLFLLQEEENHPDEGSSRTRRLADALGLQYAYLPARMKGTASHGLAILSAYPIVDIEEMELPYADLAVAEARRIAVAADILVDGVRLHVINVHLDTVLNVTDRILQIRPAVIDAPEAVLVAGDMNTNDWLWAGPLPVWPAGNVADTRQAPILDDYMRAIGFATPCSGIGPTEHMASFEFRLDAFFPRGLTVGACHVQRDVNLSDHWPLWIDVTLP